MASSHSFFNSKEPVQELKRKLHTAMTFVKNTCVIGSNNKIDDIINSNGWAFTALFIRRHKVNFIKANDRKNEDTVANVKYDTDINNFTFLDKQKWFYRYQPVKSSGISFSIVSRNSKQRPLHDPKFGLTESQHNLLVIGLLCQELRGGVCSFQSSLIAKYLWENCKGIDKIETVGASNFEHQFTIINRIGNLNDPTTWGDNAWIIDSWYGEQGIIYHASEFKEMIVKIKAHVEEQTKQMIRAGLNFNSTIKLSDNPETKCFLICEIKPQETPYPTYSKDPFYPLEYYYMINLYPSDLAGNDKNIPQTTKGDNIRELNYYFKNHEQKLDCVNNSIKKDDIKRLQAVRKM